MLMAQPLAFFRVMIVLTVPELIWSNDVQVGLDRVVQLPLELHVMPAARNCAAAWDCVSLVPLALAVGAMTPTVATAARTAGASSVRTFMHSSRAVRLAVPSSPPDGPV